MEDQNRINILEQQMYLIHKSMEHQKKRLEICKSMIVSNKKTMKVYFTRWCNGLLGSKNLLSLWNYAKFYNLRRLPEYIEVRNSSAGIKGWGQKINWGSYSLMAHRNQDRMCEARSLKPFMLCDPI